MCAFGTAVTPATLELPSETLRCLAPPQASATPHLRHKPLPYALGAPLPPPMGLASLCPGCSRLLCLALPRSAKGKRANPLCHAGPMCPFSLALISQSPPQASAHPPAFCPGRPPTLFPWRPPSLCHGPCCPSFSTSPQVSAPLHPRPCCFGMKSTCRYPCPQSSSPKDGIKETA